MNILEAIYEDYKSFGSLKEKKVVVCTHLTQATSQFVKTLTKMGATVYFYVIDFSKDAEYIEELRNNREVYLLKDSYELIKVMPHIDIIFEDGARISKIVYENLDSLSLKDNLFSIEQTTNGIRFFQRQNNDLLLYPVINVSESKIKTVFDNAVATPESILTCFLSIKEQPLTRQNVLIIGAGNVGNGLADLFREHGSFVSLMDSNPLKRVIAQSKGYDVYSPENFLPALRKADIIVCSTDNHKGSIINIDKILLMKDGSCIMNAGSGKGEIDQNLLIEGSFIDPHYKLNIEKDKNGLKLSLQKLNESKTINIISEGHPINLHSGKGTPTEVIQLVFALMFLSAIHGLSIKLSKEVHQIDHSLEQEVAKYMEIDSINRYVKSPVLLKSTTLSFDTRDYGGVMKFGSIPMKGFSLARARFLKGKPTLGHYHLSSEEAYLIEEGIMRITLWKYDDPEKKVVYMLEKGDYLMIPPEYTHHVVSMTDVCDCLVIASPPFSIWDQFFHKTQ